MATYSELRDKVLTLTDMVGVTEAQNIAAEGLERTMNYVAQMVTIPSLEPEATYTWQANDTEASISTDFSVSDYEVPVALFVGDTPYTFRSYLEWLELKAVPGRERTGISTVGTYDERPSHVWTVKKDEDTILLSPLPSTDDVLTLHYGTSPSAYGDGSGTPPLPAKWQNLLVDGAVAFVKDWERNQEVSSTPYKLLDVLNTDIERLHQELLSKRQRRGIRLNASYRIPR